MMASRPIELLSPAKNAEIGIEAINHGADAVYIGAPRFGARAAAGNDTTEIARLVDYAHKYDARVYVALNTILKDDELLEAERIIGNMYSVGVDALIVQDMGILELDIPPIALHASTQTDNRTVEKVRFLENAGFSQVVLARELSLEQIQHISENTTVPLEVFIHGALCVSYSGQCYLSHCLSGRSANRGECAQYCRLPYTLLDADGKVLEKNKHLLSLKDMNRTDSLEALLDAGVSSLKIEGRMKTEYYVATIVSGYRHLIDEIYENQGPLSQERLDYHKKQILYGENREVCSGFYAGNANADSLIYHETSNADVNHDFLGTVVGIDGTHVTIETRNKFNRGETLEILSPYNTVRQFHVDSILNAKNEVIETANQPMTRVQIDIPFEVHEKDILRRSR